MNWLGGTIYTHSGTMHRPNNGAGVCTRARVAQLFGVDRTAIGAPLFALLLVRAALVRKGRSAAQSCGRFVADPFHQRDRERRPGSGHRAGDACEHTSPRSLPGPAATVATAVGIGNTIVGTGCVLRLDEIPIDRERR
jgi:hypothetical protein